MIFKKGLQKKGFITLVVASVIILGIAMLFGSLTLKTLFPRIFVSMAATNTARQITPQAERVEDLVTAILAGSWRQDFSIGINDLGVMADEFDADELAALMYLFSIFTVDNSTRWNERQEAFASDTSLVLRGSPLISLDLFLDRNTFGFAIPQAVDYFITFNARSMATDLNHSPVGLGMFRWLSDEEIAEMDALAYEYYIQMFFERGAAPEFDLSDLEDVVLALLDGIEYRFDGRQAIEVGGRNTYADAYNLTIPVDYLNEAAQVFNAILMDAFQTYVGMMTVSNPIMWGLISSEFYDFEMGISFDRDIELTVYVDGSSLAGVDFDATVNIFAADESFELLVDTVLRFPQDGSGVIFDLSFVPVEYGEIFYDEALLITGSWTSLDTADRLYQNLDMVLEADDYVMTINWMVDWDINNTSGDNFEFLIGFSTDDTWTSWDGEPRRSYNRVTVGGVGSLLLHDHAMRIEADFGDLFFKVYEDFNWRPWREPGYSADFSFNVRYVLQADDTPIPFDRNNTVSVRDFNYTDFEEFFIEMEEFFEAMVDELMP